MYTDKVIKGDRHPGEHTALQSNDRRGGDTLYHLFKPFPHQGMTFRIENGELVIARILHGGMIDQQGLLHVGDIIKEVNNKDVGDDPRVLQEVLQEASGSIVLKVLPSYQEPQPPKQVATWSRIRPRPKV